MRFLFKSATMQLVRVSVTIEEAVKETEENEDTQTSHSPPSRLKYEDRADCKLYRYHPLNAGTLLLIVLNQPGKPDQFHHTNTGPLILPLWTIQLNQIGIIL